MADIFLCFHQADYSRHLEEIATRTESHLLAAVRRRLMTRGSCALLAKWEQFRQLADRGTAMSIQHVYTST